MLTFEMVEFETPTCMHCGKRGTVIIPKTVVDNLAAGMTVQQAWPYSAPSDREMIITGTHPECWELMFGGKDCE